MNDEDRLGTAGDGVGTAGDGVGTADVADAATGRTRVAAYAVGLRR